MKVFIFGDSIVQGFFDAQEGGWVNQLAVHYQKHAVANLAGSWTEIYNLGVSGVMSDGVLERIEPEFNSRQLYQDDNCIVIAVGINDSVLRDNRVITEVSDFQEIYESIIDKALSLCPRVICVGLSAVEEAKTDPWAYSSTGKQWKNNRINLFEDSIKQSALIKEVAFVPIHDEFLKLSRDNQLLADGLHPNHEGHSFIAKEVLAAIEALR